MKGVVSHPGTGFAALYGATFVLFWPGGVALAILAAALAPLLIWISLQDFNRYEIPDPATVAVAAIALIYIVVTRAAPLLPHLVTGAVVTLILWAAGALYFHRAGREGLGIGDAKLFGAGTLLLGPSKLPELFLLASLGGIAGYCLARVRNPQAQSTGVPFGPFIAYAIFVLCLIEPIFL